MANTQTLIAKVYSAFNQRSTPARVFADRTQIATEKSASRRSPLIP
jgi:hypothetical protein